jgi:hypothetical protein
MVRIVASRSLPIARELVLRSLPELWLNECRHADGDPLVPRAPGAPLAIARVTIFEPALLIRPPYLAWLRSVVVTDGVSLLYTN